jgi:hypothetical protein
MRELTIAVTAWLFLAAPGLVHAQDFRVETDVFLGKQKEPTAQYLTIFRGGVVYDFLLGDPKEVTVHHVQQGRFLLLDPVRRVQTTVTTDDLLRLSARLKAEALASKDPDVRFLAEPSFDVTFDSQQRRVVLTSPLLTYEAKGLQPGDAGIVRRYRDFADGYARLNGIRLGNIPPFARMQLNEQLAQHGLAPQEVIRSVPSKAAFGKEVEIRSRHLITERILPTDEKKIGEADNYLQTFEHVELANYLQWPKRVAKAD